MVAVSERGGWWWYCPNYCGLVVQITSQFSPPEHDCPRFPHRPVPQSAPHTSGYASGVNGLAELAHASGGNSQETT